MNRRLRGSVPEGTAKFGIREGGLLLAYELPDGLVGRVHHDREQHGRRFGNRPHWTSRSESTAARASDRRRSQSTLSGSTKGASGEYHRLTGIESEGTAKNEPTGPSRGDGESLGGLNATLAARAGCGEVAETTPTTPLSGQRRGVS